MCLTRIAIVAMTLTAMATSTAEGHVNGCDGRAAPVLCDIHHWRDATWRLERRVAAHPTRYDWTAERRAASASYRMWVRHRWNTRYHHWWNHTHPWTRGWWRDILCIHQHEGAWVDPGAPYWGGLQMDRSFMASYGARFLRVWGTADHWPPLAQILAAWRAYASGRGFAPWPNTAAMCGLL